MSILQYKGKSGGKSAANRDPYEEAAILDFIMGDASCRQAAEVVGVTQQGMYTVTLNQIRHWLQKGEISLKGVKERVLADIENMENLFEEQPR